MRVVEELRLVNAFAVVGEAITNGFAFDGRGQVVVMWIMACLVVAHIRMLVSPNFRQLQAKI